MIDRTLSDLCDRYGIDAIGINLGGTDKNRFAVFMHWGASECVYGYGPTFDEALSEAIAKLATARATNTDMEAAE